MERLDLWHQLLASRWDRLRLVPWWRPRHVVSGSERVGRIQACRIDMHRVRIGCRLLCGILRS